ncbi:MAG: hypothetical protein OTI37_04250 [Planctomycetota bacterium]|nr:hypothetical protein [Planctomycetota bacterium]
MEIKNTSKTPLKVPLPGGKNLFLGIGATGKISDKAAEHPPFKELADSGAIEILGSGRSKTGGSSSSGGGAAGSNTGTSGGASMRKSGDR